MALLTHNLCKNFGDKTAVSNVNITLEKGVYALLGPNGAGKTTLMRMICGLQMPSNGDVNWNDTNITTLGSDYLEKIGYLPQHFGFYPSYTPKQFMLYLAQVKGIPRRFATQQTQQLLCKLDLADVQNKKIQTLSGGMIRRLGIAQALLGNPEILILDEPTAGLDPKERIKFRNLISDYSSGRLVLLSTHIVSDVECIANHIIMMKQGRILFSNSPSNIISQSGIRVWECNTSVDESKILVQNYSIVNQYLEENHVRLRLIAKNKPHATALEVPANLEDVYLYYFTEEGEVRD
ncbi:MAG: ATP-binding cassette domain-containing protein [Anaerovoracaceae bacterium]